MGTTKMNNELELFKQELEVYIDYASIKFNMLYDIPKEPTVGDIIHIPQLMKTPENNINGSLKDITYDINSLDTIHKMAVGYALFVRVKPTEDNSILNVLIAQAIEYFKIKKGFGPDEPHYGKFIEVVGITEIGGGIELTFKSNAIKFNAIKEGLAGLTPQPLSTELS